MLETDREQPWRRWAARKTKTGRTVSCRNIPRKSLDHLGGDPQEPGAKIDIWTNVPGDQHLQWFIKPLAGFMSPAVETPPSTYVAPEIKRKLFSRAKSRIARLRTCDFPGHGATSHGLHPAQYDGSRPACVYVKTDGYNPSTTKPARNDDRHQGDARDRRRVITPGNVPRTVKNTIGRRNRCFEYDGVGDSNVRFLVDEILPFVAKQFDLKLSTSGNDRCIAGGSSGGITAFNAAWERPDAFSRVYANSGSFVAFRGGHEFPTLIRKFEARPIRAYLTTGTRDMENCAGDWFLLDQEMDKALKFSGYDYFFRIINGGHVAGYYDHFQEAMSYIWKNWPEPVQAGPSRPRVRDIIIAHEPWQLVAKGLHDVQSPACNAHGEVYFVERKDDAVRRIDLDGRIETFLPAADLANGSVCRTERRALHRLEPNREGAELRRVGQG